MRRRLPVFSPVHPFTRPLPPLSSAALEGEQALGGFQADAGLVPGHGFGDHFSQAELCLLMRCCRRPNDMFFTGDTAQSIMRGIAFRFEDLKSLFYHMSQTMQAQEHTKAIQVSISCTHLF